MTELPWPLITNPDRSLNVDALQGNFDALKDAIPDTGGASLTIRAGAASVVFAASDASNVPTVTHGLGRVPVAVVATSNIGSGVIMSAVNSTATTFQVQGRYPFGPITGTIPYSWIAIG